MFDEAPQQVIKIHHCTSDSKDKLSKLSLEVWDIMQKQDLVTKCGVSRTGYLHSAEGLLLSGKLPEVLSLIVAEPATEEDYDPESEEDESDATFSIKVMGICLLGTDPLFRSVDLSFAIHPTVRKKGYGSILLAGSLYWLFTNRMITSARAESCNMNTAAKQILDKFMVRSGSTPKNWNWFGQNTGSTSYTLTNDDLIFSKYQAIYDVLKDKKVEGLELLTYDAFAQTRGRELY